MINFQLLFAAGGENKQQAEGGICQYSFHIIRGLVRCFTCRQWKYIGTGHVDFSFLVRVGYGGEVHPFVGVKGAAFTYHFFSYIEQYLGIQLFTGTDCQTKGTLGSTGFPDCFEVVDAVGYFAIIAAYFRQDMADFAKPDHGNHRILHRFYHRFYRRVILEGVVLRLGFIGGPNQVSQPVVGIYPSVVEANREGMFANGRRVVDEEEEEPHTACS